MWRIIGKRKGKIEKGFLEDVKKRTRKIDVSESRRSITYKCGQKAH